MNDDARIVLWHWQHYYRMLEREDVEQLAVVFANLIKQMDTIGAVLNLQEKNRLASRMLYKYARKEGWRKLSRREAKHHNTNNHWIRSDSLSKVPGVGQYTMEASSGKKSMYEKSAE